jgi:hypothetical protein
MDKETAIKRIAAWLERRMKICEYCCCLSLLSDPCPKCVAKSKANPKEFCKENGICEYCWEPEDYYGCPNQCAEERANAKKSCNGCGRSCSGSDWACYGFCSRGCATYQDRRERGRW